MDKEFEVAKSSKRQKRVDFSIKTETYQTQVRFLENNLVFLNKTHRYKSGTYIQTYGAEWAISFANLPEGKVKIRSGKKLVPLSGTTLLFHAPYSIVEFDVQACELQWGFVGSIHPCPVNMTTSRILTNTNLDFTFTPGNILNMLKALQNGVVIKSEKTTSPIAEKVKKYIDNNYQNDLKISEVSKALNISRVVMSRAFSQTYGISPLEYRNRLRIHAALIYMRQGMSITDALYLVGFSNPSLFINNFKSYLKATPHQYKSRVRV